MKKNTQRQFVKAIKITHNRNRKRAPRFCRWDKKALSKKNCFVAIPDRIFLSFSLLLFLSLSFILVWNNSEFLLILKDLSEEERRKTGKELFFLLFFPQRKDWRERFYIEKGKKAKREDERGLEKEEEESIRSILWSVGECLFCSLFCVVFN